MSKIGSWGASSTVPNGTQQPATVISTILSRYNDIYETLNVEHDPASGRHKIPSGATASRPAGAVSGTLYYNTTTEAMELYDGTNWIPINYSLTETITGAYSLSPAGIAFRLNSGNSFGYTGNINLTFTATWDKRTVTDLTKTIELRTATSFSGLADADSVATMTASNIDVEVINLTYSGEIAAGNIYWGLYPNTGVLGIASGSDTRQVSYLFIGK